MSGSRSAKWPADLSCASGPGSPDVAWQMETTEPRQAATAVVYLFHAATTCTCTAFFFFARWEQQDGPKGAVRRSHHACASKSHTSREKFTQYETDTEPSAPEGLV